jgi:hypothetical protein
LHAIAETPTSSNGVDQHPNTCSDHLEKAQFMGVDLNTNGVVMDDGNTYTTDVVMQGVLKFGDDVADWCENVVRFCRNRVDGNEAKPTIPVMAQCDDFRLFAVSSHAPFSSFDACLEARVSPNLLRIHTWMLEKGKLNLDGFSVVLGSMQGIGKRNARRFCFLKGENS